MNQIFYFKNKKQLSLSKLTIIYDTNTRDADDLEEISLKDNSRTIIYIDPDHYKTQEDQIIFINQIIDQIINDKNSSIVIKTINSEVFLISSLLAVAENRLSYNDVVFYFDDGNTLQQININKDGHLDSDIFEAYFSPIGILRRKLISARKQHVVQLDAETIARREALDKMKKMTSEQLFQIAVRAGIYNSDGELTEHYKTPEIEINL